MRAYADLHIHSRFSYACSKDLTLPRLAQAAAKKGVALLGTGDFSHATWNQEIHEQLEAIDGTGLYRVKAEHALDQASRDVRFAITNEVATICKDPRGARKVHHLLYAPDLEQADQVTDVLAARWKTARGKDGRPMLKDCPPAQLAELVRQASPATQIVAAHAWTPWFGVFGSKGGYDSMLEAYQDQARHVLGVETGMSSTPAMNWRLPELDAYAILSGSDPHSAQTWRIGREAVTLDVPADGEYSFSDVIAAFRRKPGRVRWTGTVEVDPNYGKYHYDGHRACGVRWAPQETQKHNGLCSVCQKPVTIGVLARVEELATRPDGYRPPNPVSYVTLLPLAELVAAAFDTAVTSKKVQTTCDKLQAVLGPEFTVLLDAPLEAVERIAGSRVAGAVRANREGGIAVQPGYDGAYGVPSLP